MVWEKEGAEAWTWLCSKESPTWDWMSVWKWNLGMEKQKEEEMGKVKRGECVYWRMRQKGKGWGLKTREAGKWKIEKKRWRINGEWGRKGEKKWNAGSAISEGRRKVLLFMTPPTPGISISCSKGFLASWLGKVKRTSGSSPDLTTPFSPSDPARHHLLVPRPSSSLTSVRKLSTYYISVATLIL